MPKESDEINSHRRPIHPFLSQAPPSNRNTRFNHLTRNIHQQGATHRRTVTLPGPNRGVASQQQLAGGTAQQQEQHRAVQPRPGRQAQELTRIRVVPQRQPVRTAREEQPSRNLAPQHKGGIAPRVLFVSGCDSVGDSTMSPKALAKTSVSVTPTLVIKWSDKKPPTAPNTSEGNIPAFYELVGLKYPALNWSWSPYVTYCTLDVERGEKLGTHSVGIVLWDQNSESSVRSDDGAKTLCMDDFALAEGKVVYLDNPSEIM